MLLFGDSRERIAFWDLLGFLYTFDSAAKEVFCRNYTCPPQELLPPEISTFWDSNISQGEPELDVFWVNGFIVIDTVFRHWNILQKGD